jgi:hypothetical protein
LIFGGLVWKKFSAKLSGLDCVDRIHGSNDDDGRTAKEVISMADFDRYASVRRTCPSAAKRIVFDADLSLHPLEQIQCGIVFIHAFWASSSHLALKRIADTLARIDIGCRLDFIVCDIDDVKHLYDCLYDADRTGGNGDLSWIVNGVVRARHNASRQCDFETTTRSLLLECQDSH